MITVNGLEYKRFGEGVYATRPDADHEWVMVAVDDLDNATLMEIARQEGAREARKTSGVNVETVKIMRSELTTSIAEKLGLTADELADKLATPKDNNGTKIRLTEEEFDAEMAKIGLSPEEARARFKGTYFEQG